MYTGVFYKRYILGLWAMAEGIIYDMFSEAQHVKDPLLFEKLLLDSNRYVSCDYGTQNATVFLLWEKERMAFGIVRKNIIILDERKESRKRMQSMQTTWKIGWIRWKFAQL